MACCPHLFKNDYFQRAFAERPLEFGILLSLALVGLLRLLRFASVLTYGIWVTFFRSGKNLKKYGSWAIVTGATDGIGRGFARQFAKLGINVVLVSRTESRLSEVAQELQSKYKVQTKIVVADFTDLDVSSCVKKVADVVDELDIGILVNNVGLSYSHAQYLHELDSKFLLDLLKVNVEATTRLTQLVLRGMVERRRGAIVNIGSGAASVLPSDPLYSAYAGTKGYVDQFSRSLYVEYKSKGIDVQCQAPLYVATKLSKIRKTSLTCPSADTYAQYGIKWIGYEPRVTPYWAHHIMWWLVAALPESVMDDIRLSQNISIRKRALLKVRKAQ